MKNLKFIILLAVLFTAGFALQSCKDKGTSTDAPTEVKAEPVADEAATDEAAIEKVAKQGPEYTSAYICPMYCEGSGSDKAGNCPKCGMDYVMNKEIQQKEDSHEGHDHEGHTH